MVYCTLFDSNYLDKGIVMIESLQKVDNNALMYVLCMDDKCKEVLDDYGLSKTKTIGLNEFEDSDLNAIKEKRSHAEFCWTCTAKLIKYVIDYFGENLCTYVDSDLYFYTNPSVLIEEMKSNNCVAQTISHRFPNTINGRYQMKQDGRNCVQFNTFTNHADSKSLLNQWVQQCIDECSLENSGDQKYTDAWCEVPYVNIPKNGGAGIAPWNLNRYKLVDRERQIIYDRFDKKRYTMVFYHFQNIVYIERLKVRVMPKVQHWIVDNQLMDYLYIPYLVKIERVKKILETKYDIIPTIKSYVADSRKEHTSLKDKIMANINQPLPIFFMKVDGCIRRFVRKNKLIIDISHHL